MKTPIHKITGPATLASVAYFALALSGYGALRGGDPDLDFEPCPVVTNGEIYAIAVQSDGKVIVGGTFTGSGRNGIARLNPDGSLDSTFQDGMDGLGPGPNYINSIAVQSDGKVVIGGYFGSVNGTDRGSIARLNGDGSLDTGFQSGMAGATVQYCFSEFDCYDFLGEVFSVAVQTNGTILVGGHFDRFNLTAPSPHGRLGGNHYSIARLKSDGSLDATFQEHWLGTDPPNVNSVAVQTDGKVILAGDFGIARLNPDGKKDTNFVATVYDTDDAVIYAVTLQSNGKVLVGGRFSTVNGLPRSNVARLNSNGTLDTNFVATVNNVVFTIVLQSNGKVLIGGGFSSVNGTNRGSIARVNSDGTLDATFQNGMMGANDYVWPVALQPDGRIVMGGQFSRVNGVAIPGLGRLYGTAPVRLENIRVISNHFGFDMSGESDQVVVVEASTNLVNWSPLTTNTFGAAPLFFSDPTPLNLPKRFYRARVQ